MGLHVVLDPGARQEHPDQEAAGDPGQGEADRVLLGDPDRPLGAVLQLLPIRGGFANLLGGAT